MQDSETFAILALCRGDDSNCHLAHVAGRAAQEEALTPEQLRDARKLLGWTIERLAAFSDINAQAVRDYEFRGRIPSQRSSRWWKPDVLATIRSTLEDAGVTFVDDDRNGPAVRLRAEGEP